MANTQKFLDKLEDFVIRNRIIRRDDKILIGFSGGADSTALTLGLWHLRSKLNLTLLAAHVNYQLRGKDSEADRDYVKQFCFDRNISLVIKDIKLEPGANLENRAREIRFTYFDELSKQYLVDKILLGHNRMDQAETFLFHMIRGAGYTGLKGIAPVTGKIAHPLIEFSRTEIENFLKKKNVSWREDLTNQETKFSRNKIRHDLIPWIESNLNNRVVGKITETARICLETDEILYELSRRRLHHAQIKHFGTDIRLALNILRRTRSVLRFYMYREAYRQLKGDNADFYHNHFLEIEHLINSQGCKIIDLSADIQVKKTYKTLIIQKKTDDEVHDPGNEREITNLRNRLTFEDYRIIMKKIKKLDNRRNLHEDKFIVYLDMDKFNFPLMIRHRKPGDFFQPYGMKHRKKLKDFFIDEKVPKFERDRVLLFCDPDKIIWIAGQRIDDRVAVTESTRNILRIKLEKITSRKARPAERVKKDS